MAIQAGVCYNRVSRHLRLYTLGTFQALLDGQALRGFALDKERALLATLALEARDLPVRRETLMRLFWDGFTDETARHSLRNALYGLRKLLAPLDLLHTTRPPASCPAPPPPSSVATRSSSAWRRSSSIPVRA
jgi:hypothetical protein